MGYLELISAPPPPLTRLCVCAAHNHRFISLVIMIFPRWWHKVSGSKSMSMDNNLKTDQSKMSEDGDPPLIGTQVPLELLAMRNCLGCTKKQIQSSGTSLIQ